jgi:hypothetical protein
MPKADGKGGASGRETAAKKLVEVRLSRAEADFDQ